MSLRDVIAAVRSAPGAPSSPPVELPATVSASAPVLNLSAEVWNYLRRLGTRRDPTRESGFHPSQAHGFCPRLPALARRFPRPEAGHVSPSLRMTFDWGSAWHQWAQDHYFGPMGVLWGTWRAPCCGRIEAGFLPAPCAKCHPDGLIRAWHAAGAEGAAFGGFWNYREPKFRIEAEGIVGRCDGWLRLDRTEFGPVDLLEIKTINGRGFSRLMSANEGHAFQSRVYMGLAMEDPVHPKPRRAWVAYFSKEDTSSPPKCLPVEPDPGPLAEWRRRIALAKRSEADGWRLVPGICRSRLDDTARYCSHADLCFADDIEAVVDRQGPVGGAL